MKYLMTGLATRPARTRRTLFTHLCTLGLLALGGWALGGGLGDDFRLTQDASAQAPGGGEGRGES